MGMSRGLRAWRGITPVTLLSLALAACGDAAPASNELRVVATTTILGDVVGEIVGTEGSVEVLTPQGVDPHDYRASSRQVASINEADLVVANGLGLEEGLEDVLEAAKSDGANVFAVGESLETIPFGSLSEEHEEGGEEHDEEEHEEGGEVHEEGEEEHDEGEHEEGEEVHDEGESHSHSEDPHFWMDPLRVATAAQLIASELEKVDTSIDWARRADAYVEELSDLDAEINRMLGGIDPSKRKLVTNHDALGYFADRYGFDIVGVIIPGGSTLGDPSSEELADLVAVIEEEGVPAIFAETTAPSALAEALAAEVGDQVEVVALYTGSLGEPGSGAESLIEMLSFNARAVADALGTVAG